MNQLKSKSTNQVEYVMEMNELLLQEIVKSYMTEEIKKKNPNFIATQFDEFKCHFSDKDCGSAGFKTLASVKYVNKIQVIECHDA